MLNEWQRIIIQTYRSGEYAPLFGEVTTPRAAMRVARGTNDGLFIFLMEEFSGCRLHTDAKQRLLEAQEEIHAFAAALIQWKESND